MPKDKLPSGGNSFRMSGSSGFSRNFSNLTRNGQFSNLKNNSEAATKIFESLVPALRRNAKLPYSTRIRAVQKFAKSPKVTKDDIRDFKKIIDIYK